MKTTNVSFLKKIMLLGLCLAVMESLEAPKKVNLSTKPSFLKTLKGVVVHKFSKNTDEQPHGGIPAGRGTLLKKTREDIDLKKNKHGKNWNKNLNTIVPYVDVPVKLTPTVPKKADIPVMMGEDAESEEEEKEEEIDKDDTEDSVSVGSFGSEDEFEPEEEEFEPEEDEPEEDEESSLPPFASPPPSPRQMNPEGKELAPAPGRPEPLAPADEIAQLQKELKAAFDTLTVSRDTAINNVSCMPLATYRVHVTGLSLLILAATIASGWYAKKKHMPHESLGSFLWYELTNSYAATYCNGNHAAARTLIGFLAMLNSATLGASVYGLATAHELNEHYAPLAVQSESFKNDARFEKIKADAQTMSDKFTQSLVV